MTGMIGLSGFAAWSYLLARSCRRTTKLSEPPERWSPAFRRLLFWNPRMISTHINRMREKLRAGKIVLGAGITLTDPTVTEAIAPSVDFVWIDLEHNAMTTEAMLGHLIAARAGGCASIVRI